MATSLAAEPLAMAARRVGALVLACAAGLALTSLSRAAHAQSILRHPGEHPNYAVELEPHFAFGAFDPPGDTSGTGIGAGLRLTIPVVKNGFISTINNSVGISFGFDWLSYSGNDVSFGYCGRWIPGPASTRICTQVAAPNSGGTAQYVLFPVAMQWNFWLHERFSVFGEPGLVVYYRKAKYEMDGGLGLAPLFDVGGRWHFSKIAALTVRLGYPTFSLGVSFLL
jgi:hypothetical protein